MDRGIELENHIEKLNRRIVRLKQALQIWAEADLRNTKMETSILNKEDREKVQELSK